MLSACASTSTTTQPKPQSGYVRVIGTGKNFEEARLDGFQLAVEMAVGAIVVTEKQANNNKLLRDQILKHSAGYVDDFKIIEQSGSNIRYTIVMDVRVKNSQIADVILSTGDKKGILDSSRIYAQYDTYNKERNDAERLIDNLINSYPKQAFNYKVNSTSIKLNTNRDMVIEIVSTITWNDVWVNALIENLDRVKDESKTTFRKISVVRKSKSAFSFSDDVTILYVNDETIYKKVFEGIFTTLYPVIEVMDKNNNWIIRGCGDYPNFKSIGQYVFTGTAEYVIPKNSQTFENMKNMDHVNVFLTKDRNTCYNNKL